MHPLHPNLCEQLALAHRQDLLRSAAARNARRAARRPRGSRSAWRLRIGWKLVEIGLWLALDRNSSGHKTIGRPA